MNKQQLANKIWASANKMRSKIEASEYKDYILGFIFYKYLSEKEVKYLLDQGWKEEDLTELKEEDPDVVKYCRDNIGYFISYENLYSTWLKKGKDFDAADVSDALSAFNRLISPDYKNVYHNIFQTLELGLTKIGENSGARTKAISALLYLIKDIPMDDKQDYDVLGFIYEYLIGQFAANSGKKAGEFFTPFEISMTISLIVSYFLRDRSDITIYDPTSGSGSLLLNIGKCASRYMNRNKVKYYAQELKENTYNLTRMNLIMRGVYPGNIIARNADTLEDDWPLDDNARDSFDRKQVDCCVANPPYSQSWNNVGKEHDPRYERYGLAPAGKADYAFLLHSLYHVKNDGIMAIILPHGVLFRGGEEGEIRKNLVENNNIDAIVGLGDELFFGTSISTLLIFLRPVRENTDVLIVDASKCCIKDGKKNKLRACDIKRIVDTVVNREEVPHFSRRVSREEIRENDYNLNIPRYVDSSEPAEPWDIYASMFGGIPKAELEQYSAFWQAFPSLYNTLFSENGTPALDLRSQNVKSDILSNADVLQYKNAFTSAFSGFNSYLDAELIQGVGNVSLPHEEDILTNELFSRLEGMPLVDKYMAYQILAETWTVIATDIEMIQTEDFQSVKKVDPHMIIKKNKNKEEEEVQDGWEGRIIPFALVQHALLQADVQSIEDKETRLVELSSEYDEISDSLSDEEKEADYYSDGTFVLKEVTKKLKDLKKDTSPDAMELKSKLQAVEKLSKEEKQLKAAIKKEKAELEKLTKTTIENLTDDQAKDMLRIKWIDSLLDRLHQIPDTIIRDFVAKIEALAAKYKDTFSDIEQEINGTEASLCSLIGELEGNDFDMKGLKELRALLGGE